MNKHILIRSCITAINNTVCVVALVAVYLAKEIEFEERAIYGMASVVVWLAFSVLSVKPFQDHKEGAIMTCPCIGVCKLDPSIGRCLTLTTLGKGGYAVTMRPENRL